MRSLAQLFLLTVLMLTTTGCEESSAVSIKIDVDKNLAGSVSLCRLTIPETTTEGEGQVAGVSWQHRAVLTCSTGRFGDLNELVLADIGLTHEVAEDGHAHLRIELPRGTAARWPALLTVTSSGPRRSALSAFDPTGRMNEVGNNLRLELRLPSDVATHGFLPAFSEVASEGSKKEVSLTIPLDVALAEGPPLVWTVTWER